jgi:hypothetical protein
MQTCCQAQLAACLALTHSHACNCDLEVAAVLVTC